MRREEALQALRARSAELEASGVRSLALFGSVARGEATSQSDVDLLVEFGRPIGLLGFVRLQRLLESWLGCKVDLVPADAVKPALRQQIFAEAVRVG